ADASNPYNTYANPGLPIGPIGLPGDAAIDAALHPADGDWLYFTAVNLESGETAFASDQAGHEENVARLHEWCSAHESEGGRYCDGPAARHSERRETRRARSSDCAFEVSADPCCGVSRTR